MNSIRFLFAFLLFIALQLPVRAQITVISPAAGEQWKVGSSQLVRWSTSGVMTLAKLKYSTDGGATWTTITGSAPNTGSYNWTVPNKPSAAARFAVMDTDGSPKAESGIFSIVPKDSTVTPLRDSLAVTFPNGGETIEQNSLQKISWFKQGSIENVALEYSLDNGVTWKIIDLAAANTGNYNWTVPGQFTPFAKIRISDADDAIPLDGSDNTFSITPAATRGDLRVSWNPNAEDDLAGYRVYIGNTTRAYDLFFATVDTIYLLANLLPGNYYIAVTALDWAGNESDYSDEVVGIVPEVPVDNTRPTKPQGVNVILEEN